MSYSLRVKLGISKLNLLETENFLWADAVEIQISDYLELSKQKKKHLQRTLSEKEIFLYIPALMLHQQIEILEEIKGEFSHQKITLNYMNTVDLDTLEEKLKGYPEYSIFYDPSQKLSHSILKSSSKWILDPSYHFFSLDHKIYKLHGWHETRWVRRYGEAELQKIMKKCIQNKAEVLFFAHSGRFEEGSLCKSLLTKA